MSKFECLHKVIAECASESQRSLRAGWLSFEEKLVLKVTENWIFKNQVYFLFADNQWTVTDLEASFRLARYLESFRSDFDVFTCASELASINKHLSISWILDSNNTTN